MVVVVVLVAVVVTLIPGSSYVPYNTSNQSFSLAFPVQGNKEPYEHEQ